MSNSEKAINRRKQRFQQDMMEIDGEGGLQTIVVKVFNVPHTVCHKYFVELQSKVWDLKKQIFKKGFKTKIKK